MPFSNSVGLEKRVIRRRFGFFLKYVAYSFRARECNYGIVHFMLMRPSCFPSDRLSIFSIGVKEWNIG